MGQKTHPIGFRLGVIRTWSSKWFSEKKYASWLHEDIKIRKHIKKKLYKTGISRVEIERLQNESPNKPDMVKITIFSPRPAQIIGADGKSHKALKQELSALSNSEIFLSIEEVRKVDLDATLVAESVASQLENRVAFRRALKRTMQNCRKAGAKGVRISASGRLGGAEMGRYEWYLDGRVPLHTLRADIDYGTALAHTTYGVIGVKCWIFKGEVLDTSAGKTVR
jgi:small subunit ribosomal protein S3